MAERNTPAPDEVVAVLDRQPSSSEEHRAKFEPLIADRQRKIPASAVISPKRRVRKARSMKSIFEESDNRIGPVLNDWQMQKYVQMKEQSREQKWDCRQ